MRNGGDDEEREGLEGKTVTEDTPEESPETILKKTMEEERRWQIIRCVNEKSKM